jgi:ATP-dependent Clp protease ATP-binding subunit ClpA
MFERFTPRARRAVVLAQEEARLLNHNYIGTEHILLGLLAERESVAARALSSLDISLGAAREQVREIIGEGQQSPSGHVPFTPRAKKVLELSLREALSLHSDTIGTEHLLLGLITEGEGVGAQILERLGAPAETVRETVLEVAGAEPDPLSADVPIEASVSRWPGTARLRIEALSEFRDLLRSIDRRLSAIERHLGMAPDRDEPAAPDTPAAESGEPSGRPAPASEQPPEDPSATAG